MAGNEAPRDSDKLQQALGKAVNGAHLHGVDLHLKHDETRLESTRLTLFNSEIAYDQAQIALGAAEKARSDKDDEIEKFVRAFKAELVHEVGGDYGPLYQLAGFAADTTQIPDDTAGRITILLRIPGVLTANPGLVNINKGVTLARADTLIAEWNAALGNVTSAERANDAAETARDNAYKAARKGFIGLVDELDEELSEDNTRWWDFGLNRPIDPAEPDAPDTAPTVEAIAPGTVRVSNLILPRRADACFVRTQIVGEQDSPQSSGGRVLDETTLTSLTTGKTLRIFYCGVNADGNGPLSPGVDVVVG